MRDLQSGTQAGGGPINRKKPSQGSSQNFDGALARAMIRVAFSFLTLYFVVERLHPGP